MITDYRDAIFYHFYPLGFCGALYKNNTAGRHDYYTETKPINRLQKLNENWLNHIESLGINAIYFGPLFESTYHGYDTADYFWIDRRLGTNDVFKNLVSTLHQKNIRVIVDGVFNHVGRSFWAFKDVIQNHENSQYKDWFYLDFNSNNQFNDGFSYEGWEGCLDLVKLNLQNPNVKKHLFDAASYWIDNFDIDGIRFDVAYCIDKNFLQEISHICKQKKENFWLLGEMIHGDYNEIANKNMLHSATNYECYKGLYSSLNEENYYEIAYALNRQFGSNGIYKNIPLYNFADNHDTDRVASSVNGAQRLFLLYALLFTMPGIPSIYYGSEWGVHAKKDCGDEAVRQEFNIEQISQNPQVNGLCEEIKELSEIRRATTALRYGDYKEIFISNGQLGFLRTFENEKIIVLLNLKQDSVNLDIPCSGLNGQAFDLKNGGTFSIKQEHLSIDIPPFWFRILKLC
jgi:cyclomaltodextrinase / maltogenic alpha-amylase / neopullulanase